jgi:hypothetical protein
MHIFYFINLSKKKELILMVDLFHQGHLLQYQSC